MTTIPRILASALRATLAAACLFTVPRANAAPAERDTIAPAPWTRDTLPAAPVPRSAVHDTTSLPDTAATPYRLVDAGDAPARPPETRGEPAGLAADPFGRMYVSDAAEHRVERYSERGAWLGTIGGLGSGDGELRRPGAMAAVTLTLAVLDRENRRVVQFDVHGVWQGTVVNLASDDVERELGRVDPIDLAVDRGGGLYVLDGDGDRILAFDVEGRHVRTFAGRGTKPGAFRGIAGLAVGRRGDVVVAERGNRRVQRLDPGGRVLATWPLEVGAGRLPLAVAVDDSGRVAVADGESGTLRVFDGVGTRLAVLRGLRSPAALAFHRDGSLLVAERRGGVRRLALARASPSSRSGP